MTDELDRVFELLVEALSREARLAVPFAASEVHERLVPYRSTRSRLHVATHQDYEMTVLRLLSGERDYVRLEPPDAREQLRAEATSINPDTGFFRNFPDAQVLVNRIAAERHLRGHQDYTPPPAPPELPPVVERAASVAAVASEAPPDPTPAPPPTPPAPAAAPAPSAPPSSDASLWTAPPPSYTAPAFELVEPRDQLEADHCAYCGGPLPTNRDVNFCPHCGQPSAGEPRCPACGVEVDVGWAYCVSCGRPTGFE